MSTSIDVDTVKEVARLANLPITDQQADSLLTAFSETLGVFKNLSELQLTDVEPTSQVTGQENVLRDDVVIDDNTLTQSQALQSAKNTHEGFFVVARLIDEK